MRKKDYHQKILFPQKFLKDKLNAVTKLYRKKSIDGQFFFSVEIRKRLIKTVQKKIIFLRNFPYKGRMHLRQPGQDLLAEREKFSLTDRKLLEKIFFSKKRSSSKCSHGSGEGRFDNRAKTTKTLWKRIVFFAQCQKTMKKKYSFSEDLIFVKICL